MMRIFTDRLIIQMAIKKEIDLGVTASYRDIIRPGPCGPACFSFNRLPRMHLSSSCIEQQGDNDDLPDIEGAMLLSSVSNTALEGTTIHAGKPVMDRQRLQFVRMPNCQ
ncbi:unnamed protein product [Anisakis simplex]|uniref:Uncharacterized protein n=1 Tax=Anisakis simplex TaxID=6269 RepID=A0A0M3JAT0_ANISI|nr:unnamed protein product [Anisakis simplex]